VDIPPFCSPCALRRLHTPRASVLWPLLHPG
jgi:hypothetical protein